MSCIYEHVERFDENPAMTLQDIKETKCDGRTHTRTHAHTHARTDNVKTVYPPQTKFAGGIMITKNLQYAFEKQNKFCFLFDLILYTPTIFQFNRDGSSWV